METFDDVLVKHTNDFMDKAKKDGKPFFIWHNTDAHARLHAISRRSTRRCERNGQ